MEYIEFGKIVNTHALKGEIKIYSYTDNIENILSLKNVYINNQKYTVSNSRFLKGMFTMKLKEVNSIEEAEKLVGSIIYKFCVSLAIRYGLTANDMKLVIATLFLVILIITRERNRRVKTNA